MPEFLVKAAFLVVSSSIEQRAGFSIDDLNLESDVETIRCSTLLIASSEDTFVGHEHSEEIFSRLRLHDNKEILYTKGEHYGQRDRQILNTVYSFLEKNLRKYGEPYNAIRHHLSQEQSIEKISRTLKSYEPKPVNSPKVITNAFSY
jgi:hypothetical protein